jgi:uncharacterized membrane protein
VDGALIALLVLFLIGLLLLAPVLAIVALTRTRALRGELESLQARFRLLEARVGRAATPSVAAPEPAGEPAPAEPTEPATPEPVAPAPPEPARPPAVLPEPAAQRPDLATSLGPKLLVAAGALAVFAALAFFVKYAWENEWVGPTGRVLSGAVFSLGLITFGLRLLRREYRPLGQGLAGAGFAGLFTVVFGAHGFYDLIPRVAAFVLLVGIVAAALALAERLDLRLLAALAWIGGYLTPALLSTGEDRAVGLFAYLFLLDAGALLLDRRKPWPETMPLAFTGTMLLYAGWWGRFYHPGRFTTAACGLALFTALFALGPASKQRGILQAFVVMSAAALTLAMADVRAGAGPMLLSLAVGFLAQRFAVQSGGFFRLLSGFALFVPFLAWVGRYSPDQHFLTGAAWVLGAVLLFVVGDKGVGGGAAFFRAAAFVLGGLCAAGLAGQTDAPALVVALLLALAAIATLLRRSWPWSEAAGVATAAIAVVAWYERFYAAGRERDAILIAVAVSGAYLLALVVRGLLFRSELGAAGAAAHLGAAALLWGMLFQVLYASNPTGLGLTSLALAAFYLVIGLALRGQQPIDALHARTALGLAAGFVTIAIPVQLGLHGITLAWAVWGLLLLGLGSRFGSVPARLGGYAVLALATLRLFARHLPLHDGPFTPVLNPSFGVWLFVIGALVVAMLLTRSAREEGSPEATLHPMLGTVALVLLFGLLTSETNAFFGELAREGVANARLMGGLAISVLWSVFATALLAAGLGLRNRALFYAAYALFGVAALKAVLVDLAALHTIYRILSFLALGVLLLGGAGLTIRFRARLLPRVGA